MSGLHDTSYTLQIIFMLIGFVFMSLVLKEQLERYRSTRTEYMRSRRILLALLVLIFMGNFTHLEPGHMLHAILIALVGFTWWYWYRIIAEELEDRNKLLATAEALKIELALEAKFRKAQLKSVKTYQQAQSEAIGELSPKTVQKINDLTQIKNIEKVVEQNNIDQQGTM